MAEALMSEEFVLPDAQQRRLERMRRERHFLLDVQLSADSTTSQLMVSGSTGNVYTITIDANACQMRCSCPDFDGHSYYDKVLCKHCCFVIYRVFRTSLQAGFFDEDNMQRAFSPNEMACFQRKVAHLARVSLESPVCKTFVSPQYCSRYKALLTSKSTNVAHSAAQSTDNVARETNVSQEDGSAFGRCLAASCSHSELQDFCGICYEELSDVKASDALIRCGECAKILHEECATIWLEKNDTCVYCRAWHPYASFLAAQKTKAPPLPAKRRRESEATYLNVALSSGTSAL